METLKKIGGFLLMAFAILLALAVIATLPNSISESLSQIQKDTVLGIGYFFGTMIANGIVVLIIIFMIKTGLKLIQNKKAKDKTVPRVGF